MRKIGYSILSLGLVLSLSGCTAGATGVYQAHKRAVNSSEVSDRVREAMSTLESSSSSENESESSSENESVSVGENEVGTQVKYSSADLKLYNSLIKDYENLTFSPYSLRDCIGLIYNGSNDVVKAMLDKEFGFGTRGLDHYNNYDKSLSMGKEYGVAVANKAYVRDLDELNLEVLNTKNIEEADMNETVKTSEMMNKYISDNTKEKIKNLIKPEHITPETSLIAINCLYFKQKWEQDEREINWKDSNIVKGFGDTTSDITIAKEVGDLDVLRLKYDDCDYSMYIICDNAESDTKNVDKYLSEISIDEYMDILDFSNYEGLKGYDKIYYSVPEFKMDQKFSLIKYLKDNGYEGLLGFDSFNKLGDVHISDVLQGTYIDVNKEGTEAAAATAIVMKTNSAMIEPSKIKDIIVNDTFHFVIKDDITNEILFMGRVDDIKQD